MGLIRIISAAQAAQVFTVSDALEAVENAYRQKASGAGQAWPMVYEQFEPGAADIDIRSANLGESGLFGLKLTAWFSKNPDRGLPDIYGTVLICDNNTGQPLALLNASALTGLRTGAAAALGIKALACEGANRLLVVGAGHMCPFAIAATLAACPSFNKIAIWDPRKKQVPEARLATIGKTVNETLDAAGIERTYQLVGAEDGPSAVAQAQAIITVTPATTPVVQNEWVQPGTHISCVGADMHGKQELANALISRARLFVDDRDQSVSSGELEIPVKEGTIQPQDIVAELGEVLAGTTAGRTTDDQITVFDTSGIALQDLASAQIAFERAVERSLGSSVEL
ncbi:ornithine cyclodeaminase family protein [Parvibacter caecicola]|uniref:ornithine cyclodeaminase family protein n=1 Tax=Parvibacter caecicola TaxID=747645 RepID=UPI0023F07307|nr:ornithine cyclodeaminase family protein [Parvibacter caecicola]